MAALRLLVLLAAMAAQLMQQGQASEETPAARVMLQVVCSVSNETDCNALTPNLEAAFEPILGQKLGIPEELLVVSVACGKDAEGMDSPGQVVVDVLVQILADVSTNITAHNLSAVEDLIGTGKNQSHPEDYVNEAVQVVTLNVVERGAMLTSDGLQQELSNSPRLTTDVAVESVSSPTVELQTSTTSSSTSSSATASTSATTSTSTSLSSSSVSSSSTSPSTTSSPASDGAADTSVLSFSLLITIQGSGSTTDVQAAEAFSNDAEAINALRSEYAANISVDPSTVEVNVTVLPDSGGSLRRRMATAANIEVFFTVHLPAESAGQVEEGTRALSTDGFQDFVNVALSASATKEIYASAVVQSIENIKVVDPDATLTSTTPVTVTDSGCWPSSGINVGLILIAISIVLNQKLLD